jgi:hypothetical protein
MPSGGHRAEWLARDGIPDRAELGLDDYSILTVLADK